jgi:hypothetical protein
MRLKEHKNECLYVAMHCYLHLREHRKKKNNSIRYTRLTDKPEEENEGVR